MTIEGTWIGRRVRRGGSWRRRAGNGPTPGLFPPSIRREPGLFRSRTDGQTAPVMVVPGARLPVRATSARGSTLFRTGPAIIRVVVVLLNADSAKEAETACPADSRAHNRAVNQSPPTERFPPPQGSGRGALVINTGCIFPRETLNRRR